VRTPSQIERSHGLLSATAPLAACAQPSPGHRPADGARQAPGGGGTTETMTSVMKPRTGPDIEGKAKGSERKHKTFSNTPQVERKMNNSRAPQARSSAKAPEAPWRSRQTPRRPRTGPPPARIRKAPRC
jgi:hypothetical protein